MAEPADRLALSLERLEKLQSGGRRVFRSKELTRIHRERLLQNGFLRRVIHGWLIPSSPGVDPGDTTPWHASFWEFCARYCAERFSDQWHLSPEQSLLLHAENTVIPRRVVIYTPRGTNNTLQLPFETSLYDLKEGQLPPRNDMTERDGLVLYTPEAALTRVSESFFTRYPVEAQVALAGVPEATDMLRRLLNGGHSTIAGRLAGAMRRIERPEVADVILGSMRAAGYDVRETDPFTPSEVLGTRKTTPIVSRLQAMWETFREPVIDLFPSPPGLPSDQESYLQYVDEIYKSDAYHSLSIEGYRVTPVLVERVRSGQWDPDGHATDKQSSDALAARGYWQAFQLVRDAVSRIVAGEDAVDVVITSHRDWYLELFQLCVAAGLVQASVLAGCRNDAVFLRGSRHVPPRPSSVRDAVPTLFNLLKDEPEPSVRAVLGHWMFGYIHPYPDGNGRMARFLMNAMLATGGYPWTVVRVDDRDAYMAALEEASIGADIRPFAAFIATCVADSEQLKDRH